MYCAEVKKTGSAYDSRSESTVIRLPPSSPSVLRLLLSFESFLGSAEVAVWSSTLRPRPSANSCCSCSASSRLRLFFLTRPGISLERLLGSGGNPSSSRLDFLLSRALSIKESTECLIPLGSLLSSEPLRDKVDSSLFRPSRALATTPLNPLVVEAADTEGAGDNSLAGPSIERETARNGAEGKAVGSVHDVVRGWNDTF